MAGGHHRGGLRGCADGHDLEIDQLAPCRAPGREEGAVVGPHELPAGSEVDIHPAGHVLQSVDEVPAFLTQAALDLGGGAGLEAFDHHVEHRVPSSQSVRADSRLTHVATKLSAM